MRILLIILLGLLTFTLGYMFVIFYGTELHWIHKTDLVLRCMLFVISIILLLRRSVYAAVPYLISCVILIVKILADPPIFVWDNAPPIFVGAIIGALFFIPPVRNPKPATT